VLPPQFHFTECPATCKCCWAVFGLIRCTTSFIYLGSFMLQRTWAAAAASCCSFFNVRLSAANGLQLQQLHRRMRRRYLIGLHWQHLIGLMLTLESSQRELDGCAWCVL
ncbi:hypothetical protein Dimus_007741, partial [Dionaea muscipula]